MSRPPEDLNHHEPNHHPPQDQELEGPYQESATLDKPAVAPSTSSSLATAAAAAAAAASNTIQNPLSSHSVVPDLMSVYESMTQSSTPSNQPPVGRGEYMQPQDGNGTYYYPQGEAAPGVTQWMPDSSSIPIPPPFPYPNQTHQERSRSGGRRPSSNSSNSSSGRSMRKRAKTDAGDPSQEGTRSSKARRKSDKGKDKNDGRWSKRFTWPDDLHRDFVSAIFDVGLKHSSPSTILEQMPSHEQITTERIKSHLQKYRLHRQKSKKEFMSCYNASLGKMKTDGLDNVTSLASGEVAAHLTYSSMTQPDPEASRPDEPQNGVNAAQAPAPPRSKPNKNRSQENQEMLVIPRLTEAEKHSPIGSSLGYMLGLFFSLKQQLDAQRRQEQQRKDNEAASRASLQQTKTEPPQQQHSAYGSYATGAASAAASPKKGLPMVPSTRSNLEENSMMKREMRNQMAFQNKMRALKQQEVQKYNKLAAEPHGGEHSLPPEIATHPEQASPMESHPAQHHLQSPMAAQGGANEGDHPEGDHEHPPPHHNMGMGEDDEFWNAGVVDEALFDFLLNS